MLSFGTSGSSWCFEVSSNFYHICEVKRRITSVKTQRLYCDYLMYVRLRAYDCDNNDYHNDVAIDEGARLSRLARAEGVNLKVS